MKILLALAFAAVAPAFAADVAPVAANSAGFNPLAAIHLEDLTETRDRPLFSPNRRPPPRTVEAPPAPAPVAAVVKPPVNEPPPFDLVGVVIGADARLVLLASHRGGAVSRLRRGDQQDGWRVAEINIRSVVLERDGREELLALAGPGPSPVATNAPEVADRRVDDAAMTAGPVREEYTRLMRQLAVRR